MAVEAVKNYSVNSQQPTVVKKNLKPEQNAQSIPEADEEKSNATKYMIGATVLAGIAALGIAGYKGHLGEGIQRFLGGAEKAAKKGGTNTSERASHSGSSLSVGAYGQDIHDPLEPMNAYDILSPYYQQPGMANSGIGGYGSYELDGGYGLDGGFGF